MSQTQGLTLIPRKSVLPDIVCYEQPNIEILNALLRTDLLIDTFNNPMCKSMYKNEFEQLSKYKMIINQDKKAVVRYKRTKGMSFGRVFPSMGLSLFSIRRQIRHTLAKHKYVDIDIENCHYIIILQICKMNNINVKYIDRYVNKRDEKIAEVMNVYGVSRDSAKQLFIRLLYLGSFSKWLIENNKDDIECPIASFIKKLKRELKEISDIVVKANKKLAYEVANNKNDNNNNNNSSIMSYFLQEHECTILEYMYLYLVENNVIENNECVLCADGIMILKNKYDNNILTDMAGYVKDKTGFEIVLKNKDMNEDFLSIINDHIKDETPDITSYEYKKQQFEINHFKLMNPISYCQITADGVIIRNRTDFMNCYENIKIPKSRMVNSRIVINDVKFCSEWFQDENIKVYDKMDFFPKCQAPPNVYNTFDGFQGEKSCLFNVKIEDTKMWKHMQYLCNNDNDIFNYLLKWVAHMIQKPYKRLGVSLLIRSVQGVGKDTFFNWLGNNLLGNKYYFNDANFDQIFGRFNSMIENKILIVGNEVCATDTNALFGKIINCITSPKLTIEHKGIKQYTANNYSSFVFLSNNDFPFKIPHSDRRFLSWEASAEIANNTQYFNELYAEIESGKIDKIFYEYFNKLDIEDFSPSGHRPYSEVYNEMKGHSIPPYINFLIDYCHLNNGKIIEMPINMFYALFTSYLHDNGYKYDMSVCKFSIIIHKLEGIEKFRTNKYNGFTINCSILSKFLISKGYDDTENIPFKEDEPSNTSIFTSNDYGADTLAIDNLE